MEDRENIQATSVPDPMDGHMCGHMCGRYGLYTHIYIYIYKNEHLEFALAKLSPPIPTTRRLQLKNGRTLQLVSKVLWNFELVRRLSLSFSLGHRFP